MIYRRVFIVIAVVVYLLHFLILPRFCFGSLRALEGLNILEIDYLGNICLTDSVFWYRPFYICLCTLDSVAVIASITLAFVYVGLNLPLRIFIVQF